MYLKLLVTVLALSASALSTSALSGCNSDKNIRLEEGSSCMTGRLEVCVDGQWKTMCSQRFNSTDATVVCRELGFSDKGARPIHSGFQRSSYGQSTWLYDVLCNGSEESILNCTTQPFTGYWQRSLCSNNNIGVSCQQPALGELRIVGGANRSAGRLEVFANNAWGTVCNDYWSRSDAQVACRQLGFSATGAQAVRDGFRKLNESDITPIWLDNLVCSGTEESLIDCGHNGIGIHNCRHDEDSGIVCSQESTMEMFLRQMMTAEMESEFYDTIGEVEMQAQP